MLEDGGYEGGCCVEARMVVV